MRLISRLLRIQPGEGRIAGLVVGLMFAAAAAFTIGESGVDALFFDRVGAQALPTMYLLQGGTAFAAMLALTAMLGRVRPRRAYLTAPIALAAVFLGERVLVSIDADWVYRLLWVTVAVASLVQGIYLWGTAGAVVDTRQAKRLFPLFGAGAILGAVVGGLLTRPLASAIGTANLLLVWAAGLGVVFVLSRLVLGRAPPVRRRQPHSQASPLGDIAAGFAYVRRSRLLMWMTCASVLFSVLFFTLYLPFAQSATAHFRDPDALAGFFGLFWAGTTAAAFLVSILATNRLFAWFGVAAMVVVLPVLYATAFGVLLVTSGFVTLVVLRFSLGTWLQGVSSPGWEALVNVVPEGRRDQTRAFLNGGPTQIGTVIAGILALVGQHSLTLRGFAVIGLVTALLTLGATIGIRRSYAGALVDALRAGRPQVFEGTSSLHSPVELGTDADVVRVLAGSMRSTDVHERRLAFQLLADVPAYSRPDVADAAADDDDPIVRLTAVRMLDVSTPGGRDRLLALVLDPDTSVAAAASARGLELTEGSAPAARMAELLGHRDAGVRRAAVEALAMAPPDRAAELAAGLLSDPAAEVRVAVLEQLTAAPTDRTLQPIIDALRDPDPAVRLAAGRALGSAPGSHVEEVILAALAEPETMDAGIEAVRHLELDGHRDRVREFVRSASARATDDRELAAAIPADADVSALLRDAVLDRGRRVARSGLWAATTLIPRRLEMATAIDHLDGPPAQLANALETLEAAGDPALVRPFLALWEPSAVSGSRIDWLARTLEDDDELIRRCAEFIRAEREGGSVPDSVTALSVIERVLFLRKVSLFSELAPPDLERLALLVEERGYGDGEVIADQGEMGEELHIVIAGVIRVVQEQQGLEVQLARRTEGEVVGEMSLITRSPRIATLMADGDVRTIRVGQREFASILRERPGVDLAVMRVLADRLQEAGLHSDRADPARA